MVHDAKPIYRRIKSEISVLGVRAQAIFIQEPSLFDENSLLVAMLRVDTESIDVHAVESVTVTTKKFSVSRNRFDKASPDV